MDGQGVDGDYPALNESINVDEGENQTFDAAVSILLNSTNEGSPRTISDHPGRPNSNLPFEIIVDMNTRLAQRGEGRDGVRGEDLE